MSRYRRPRPRIEDKQDDIREIAEVLYEDYVRLLKDPHGSVNTVYAALDWLGYGDWLITSRGGFTSPESPRRRARLFAGLAGKPYEFVLIPIIRSLGYEKPPARNCEKRHEWLDPYVEIDGGKVRWGFRSTANRELVFTAQWTRKFLAVYDGKVDHRNDNALVRILSNDWNNEHTLEELGLNDDDYRFMVGGQNDNKYIFGRPQQFGKYFDFAEINGVWKQLDWAETGHDWDGEIASSAREHVSAKKVIDDTGQTPVIPEDEEEDSGDERDPKAEIVDFVKNTRDNPANRSVRGNPAHIRKWNRVLAFLGEDVDEAMWTEAEIRARGEKWPKSPWGKVVSFLNTQNEN